MKKLLLICLLPVFAFVSCLTIPEEAATGQGAAANEGVTRDYRAVAHEGVFRDYRPLSAAQRFYAYFSGSGRRPTAYEIDAYIATVRRSEFQRSRANEFELRRLRDEGARQLEEGISNFDSDTLFTSIVGGQLGEYDFSRGGFEFSISNSVFANAHFPGANIASTWGDRVERFSTVFTNSSEFDLIQIDADSANRVLHSLTWGGRVHRNVDYRIFFRFADFYDEAFLTLVDGRQGYFLHAILYRIEVSANPFGDNLIPIGEVVRNSGE